MLSKYVRAVSIGALISVVSALGFFALPERVTNPERASHALPDVLSEPTKQAINQYAGRWKNLALISVLSLDFNHNTRTALYNVVPNKAVADRMQSYKADRSGENEYGKISPIFTTSQIHNKDMTRLVSGRFACVDGSKSYFAELYDLKDVIVTSCRMPIDPSVGRVVGYIVLHFVVPPLTDSEVEQIRTDTQVLATTIYFNEILPVRPAR